jgi:ectoine hydroxylase-related dioxygenase (phytanoyl-CoA dioxygenase family)
MPSMAPAEYRRHWHEAGWCVVEGVIPAGDLAAAQNALTDFFPTATEFADSADPERNAQFLSERAAPRLQFPFDSPALNRVVLHDALIDIAETLLETTDLRMYQAGMVAKYSDAAPDYEQLLHADYANHTLVVPRPDIGYQHLETFVYLSDVTPQTGATRIVAREYTEGIPIERTYLHFEEYADVYAHEEPASGPAGSVLVYRPDVFHRGVAMQLPRAARFVANVAFKPAGTDWIGYHAFPARAEDMAWHRFMREATLRQLTVLGFPAPGDPYWTAETLAGVAARYPSLDLTPWGAGVPSARSAPGTTKPA